MQRLYSMFPAGIPGAALLLLRVVCSFFVASWAIVMIARRPQTLSPILALPYVGCIAALILFVGLWTPIAGATITLVELWVAVSGSNDREAAVLLAALGAALALLGPGAFSVDAKLFGRRLIEIKSSRD